MLKNKKSIYILIPLNIFIWGFFVYRFYSAYSDTDIPGSIKIEKTTSQKTSLNDSAVYKLDLSYKDPFLKEEKHSRRAVLAGNKQGSPSQSPKSVQALKTVTLAPKQTPEVKYLGLIKNKTSGMSTALVSVNGNSRLIKPNETIDGIVFKSFNNDSLVARWGKEKIVARR
ncbi:MAG: hypothetical protein JNL60_12815 [Bacteroidia bacterium]|nr:hypothetical protein [Bacteroidia bacterium]